MTIYTLLSGETVDLAQLDDRDQAFLNDLGKMGKTGVNYFEVYRMAIGPGSPALQGRNRVNRHILTSAVYLVARDIATRVGIEQGLILAPEYEAVRARAKQNFSMISVAQAAELIGITRAAVYKAIKAGNLDAQKIGNVTVLYKASAMKLRDRRSQTNKTANTDTSSANSTASSAGGAEPPIAMEAKPE